jgi:hypothetical protein
VSLWGAELATPYSLESGSTMTSKETGETLQVGSADFCTVEGVTMMRSADGGCPTTSSEGESMATVAADFAASMTSDLGDDYFTSLMYIAIPSPNGNYIKVDVNGFVRDMTDDSVRLLSSAGVVHVQQDSFSCTDAANANYKVFEDNGYVSGTYYHLDDASDVVEASTLVRAARRLQSTAGPPTDDDVSARNHGGRGGRGGMGGHSPCQGTQCRGRPDPGRSSSGPRGNRGRA